MFDAQATLARLRENLELEGWRQTAVDRHERTGSTIAVETGYVYGEVTTRIMENRNGRNKECVKTVRGTGYKYLAEAMDDIRIAVLEAAT